MELSLSDLSGALQRAGDTGLGLTLGGVDLKSVIEILISGIDTVTSKASEIEATAEKRALQAAQELQKAKDEINKQMEKLKEETLAYTDALHEQQITALQAHRATIQSVLERQTECHSELQEATSRSFDLFSTKMDNLRMHHRHAVSCGLMGALHTNLRKIYFLKLMKNLEQRKHEQKKSNLLERLGYRTDIQRMRTAYAVLQTHARVERMRAVRIRHLRVLCNSTSKGTQRDRYRAWAAFAKVKAEKRRRKTEVNNNVVKSCMQLIATGRMRYWFSLLNKNLKYGRERRMRHEMARAMSMNTKQGQKQVVWDHWVTYLRNFQKRTKQSKVSNKFLLVVTRSVRQVYYDKWSQFRIRSRTKKMLKQKLLQLNNINEQGLKAKTYQTWMKKALTARKKTEQKKLAEIMLRIGPQNLKKEYYAKWKTVVVRMRESKEKDKIYKANRLAALASNRLKQQEALLYFYNTWVSWTRGKKEETAKEEAANKLLDLHQKTEAMWFQMELHQKTVSNTNSCVQRLVDKFMTVDDSIDRLDKVKVSRRELQGLGILEHITPGTSTPSVSNTEEVNLLKMLSRHDEPSLPAAPPVPRITPQDVASASLSASRISVDALASVHTARKPLSTHTVPNLRAAQMYQP
eukprot:TRINITY_DN9811_c0_g1_i1.p1 TRINITY_DN9811_c0_g1~~TRINITY_DN9811_c0_g1_i1.p1  ORF type:complete len:634 (+),score=127.55 TRINITY_DN9811_c0_g1_i1:35-1936(+)